MQVGDKVNVIRTENSRFHGVQWWPANGMTGTVEQIYKNGKVRVACHQLRNSSADGCVSKNFSPEHATLQVIE